MAYTVDIARDAKEAIQDERWVHDYENKDNDVRRVYLGRSYLMDPYDSGQDASNRWWESLERQLRKRGLTLEAGPDPTDQFATECRDHVDGTPFEDEEQEAAPHEIEPVPTFQGPTVCQTCGVAITETERRIIDFPTAQGE